MLSYLLMTGFCIKAQHSVYDFSSFTVSCIHFLRMENLLLWFHWIFHVPHTNIKAQLRKWATRWVEGVSAKRLEGKLFEIRPFFIHRLSPRCGPSRFNYNHFSQDTRKSLLYPTLHTEKTAEQEKTDQLLLGVVIILTLEIQTIFAHKNCVWWSGRLQYMKAKQHTFSQFCCLFRQYLLDFYLFLNPRVAFQQFCQYKWWIERMLSCSMCISG